MLFNKVILRKEKDFYSSITQNCTQKESLSVGSAIIVQKLLWSASVRFIVECFLYGSSCWLISHTSHHFPLHNQLRLTVDPSSINKNQQHHWQGLLLAIRTLLIRVINTMICPEYQYSNDFNELLLSKWYMEGGKCWGMGKSTDRLKLREAEWPHLYTVYLLHTSANRLYCSSVVYGQNSHTYWCRRPDKDVLNVAWRREKCAAEL